MIQCADRAGRRGRAVLGRALGQQTCVGESAKYTEIRHDRAVGQGHVSGGFGDAGVSICSQVEDDKVFTDCGDEDARRQRRTVLGKG